MWAGCSGGCCGVVTVSVSFGPVSPYVFSENQSFALKSVPFGSDLFTCLYVPQNEVPLTLLMFNVSIELGQLLLIAVILAAALVLHRLRHGVAGLASGRLQPTASPRTG